MCSAQLRERSPQSPACARMVRILSEQGLERGHRGQWIAALQVDAPQLPKRRGVLRLTSHDVAPGSRRAGEITSPFGNGGQPRQLDVGELSMTRQRLQTRDGVGPFAAALVQQCEALVGFGARAEFDRTPERKAGPRVVHAIIRGAETEICLARYFELNGGLEGNRGFLRLTELQA